jgi:hypothetical protein
MDPADLRPYRDALRERICAHCVDRRRDARCGRDADECCPLLMHVDLVVRTVLEVGDNAYTRPYLEAIVRDVCPACRQQAGGACALRDAGRCNLDAYLVPVVEVIEDVARREGHGSWARPSRSAPSRRKA